MAEDARIRKTKEKLSTALIQLLKEQDFIEITPAKICEKAEINRSTFYRNYRNTTQLKDEMERKILDSVDWSDRDFDLVYSRKSILKQLDFLREKRDAFSALSSNCFKESIFDKISRKLISSAISQYPKYQDKVSRQEYEKNCVFLIGGMVSIIFNWYTDGMKEDPEKVTDFILRKLEQGYQQYI